MRQHRRVVRKYDANFRIMVMVDKKLHKPLLLLTEMPLNTKYIHTYMHTQKCCLTIRYNNVFSRFDLYFQHLNKFIPIIRYNNNFNSQ